jgi:glyoxylase-like metal-dependent hydrolase (beta-lactamase superfamily II)
MADATGQAPTVKVVSVGPLGTNCYLVTDESAGETLVIDPGDEAARLMERVEAEGGKVVAIVYTHGHWDHTGADAALREKTGAPLLLHEADASWYDGTVDRYLRDGEELAVGAMRLKVIHTPGHTKGGICLYLPGLLFSGDTLFAASVGRSDFPGGSHERLIQSIKSKLMYLPCDTIVYPGHGPRTTIGGEKRSNPFL